MSLQQEARRNELWDSMEAESRKGKYSEAEGRLEDAWGWGQAPGGTTQGQEASSGGRENALRLDCGDGCITL